MTEIMANKMIVIGEQEGFLQYLQVKGCRWKMTKYYPVAI